MRNQSLALIGQYDLWVRKGVVSLCGAVLSASSKLHRVYAPATYALPIITPVANPYGCGGERAEIRIISCNSRVRILKDLSPEYGRLWNKTVNESTSKFATQRRSYALVSSLDDSVRMYLLIAPQIRTPADDPYWRPLYKFGLPSDWQESVQTFSQYRSQKPPVILVCGPKSSGKSTFCRTLTNAILTRRENQPSSDPWGRPQKATVALLDIDPGQPEFSLPGQLLLVKLQACNLGPPFVHPVINDERGRIIQLQSYGSISPKDDPPHYLDCVLKLYQSYRDLLHSHRDLPLVVNCSGWLQGGGLERQVQLIQLFEPSDVVYISDGGGQEDVIGSLAAACSTKTANFHTLSSVPLRFNLRTAAELRVMQTLSYFHLADPEAGELRWSHKPLHEVAPFVVQYSGPQQCVFAVMILGDEQDPRFFETVLSGCLVDLVLVDDDAALPKGNERTIGGELQTSHGKSGTPEYLQHPCILRSPTSIPYIPAKNRAVRPLSPKYTQCLGQALIRSIDTKNHQFHLLMPEHFVLPRLRQLEKPKIVLVRGKLETPVWAYKEPFELDKARRRRREEHLRVKEEEGADELMNNWKGTPWASVSEGKRSAGGRKRSGRRDLKYRSQS